MLSAPRHSCTVGVSAVLVKGLTEDGFRQFPKSFDMIHNGVAIKKGDRDGDKRN